MLNKLQGWVFFTCMALLVTGSARGQESAPIAKPLVPPAPSGEIVTQSFLDDAPPYTSGSSATASKPTSAANSGTAKSPEPMSANEMVRRHLGTPELAPPQSTSASKPAPKASASTNKALAEPTVSDGQSAAPLHSGAVTHPPVAVAADPVAEPADDLALRDTRPLAQRLKALRQPGSPAGSPAASPAGSPAASPAKVESWDEPQPADLAPAGPSSRRAKVEEDATAHPLSLSAPAAATSLAPATPEPDVSQAPAETFAPPARPAGLHSSRRTVVNPEDLAVPEPAAASSDNVLFKRQSPLLSVETTGPRTVVIGKEALYTVTLSNGGDVAAQDLVVGVKIPEWTDVVGSQPSAGTTSPSLADGSVPFQWRLARLEAHAKETLALRLVPRKGRPFDLNVQWTFSPIASQTMVDVQEPKLVMNIAGPDEVVYGQSKLYRLTLSNPGTGKAENVAIDLWPVGNPSGAPTRHPLGTLRAGESKVVELELTARQGGTVTIHAGASADPGLKTEATQEVLVRRAALAVAVDGVKSRYAGTVAGYTIKVTNPGNAPAENVRVSAALPPDAKFTSATQGGQWKADQGKVVWALPTLRPGEEVVLEFRCTLSVPGANKLQVMSSAAGDLNDMADIVTNVDALADLKLDVSDPAGPTAVGDEMVYELRVHNRGTKSAESVAVVAYFSDGIEPISADGGLHDISNGVVAFRPLATLAVGGEMVYRIHARAEKAGKQIFRAEVECGTLGTKLVSAEEAMIYPNDGGSDLPRADKEIARRTADPATTAPAAPERH